MWYVYRKCEDEMTEEEFENEVDCSKWEEVCDI